MSLILESHPTREEWYHEAQALNGQLVIAWIREAAHHADAVVAWKPIIDQLEHISQLADDWDGLGAQAPDREMLKTAVILVHFWIDRGLSVPTRVVAGTAGTIVFEWQENDGSYMEWEIDRPAHADIMMRLPGKPVEHLEWPTH